MRLVIKIGGSLSFTDFGPNKKYLKRLIPILKHIDKKNQLIVCVGGGQFIRKYLKNINHFILTHKEIEWLFVELLRTNVSLFSFLLKKKPIFDIRTVGKKTEGVIGGIAPGRSTDANAAICAEKIKADLFIKLTNVDGIYDKDPNKYRNVKRIKHISYKDITKYSIKKGPCSYGVLDPLAMKIINRSKIKTVIMSGKKPEKIIDVIKGKQIGTIIS